jgi:hypothetical protein
MMNQEEARLYASDRSWPCWRTIPLFRLRGCRFSVFGTIGGADPGAWLARFMEERDR